MFDSVIPAIKNDETEMIALRHHLHKNPELSLEEFKTADLVASLLETWGYNVTREIGKTGVVGSLKKAIQ